MMYKVLDVCDYILKYCNGKDYLISNLKLQKVLYFIQAQFLEEKSGYPCFIENIEAWDFGPVVPEAYYKYKVYAGGSIYAKPSENDVIEDEDKPLINNMIDRLAEWSAAELTELTQKQTPWRQAYVPETNQVISNKAIHEFFRTDKHTVGGHINEQR